MSPTLFIIVGFIAAVGFSILKIYLQKKKYDKQKHDEELKNYSETYRPKPASANSSKTARTVAKIHAAAKTVEEPFKDVAVPEQGSLSPAQYNEWLLDFAAAEKAHVCRPIKTGNLSPFARRFRRTKEYTMLYKQKDVAPQNSFKYSTPEEKVKPFNPSSLLTNEKHGSFTLEEKSPLHIEKVKLKPITFSLCPKDAHASDTFVSFYKDKN